MQPSWLAIARTYIGQREELGPKSNSWIRSIWAGLSGGAWYWKTYGEDDSKLPWCGAFCAFVLQADGLSFPAKYASAMAWSSWGEACGSNVGAIAVIKREGGGHVGFVTAISPDGKSIRLLGGNQGDAVSEAWFDSSRVVAYRKPAGATLGNTYVAAVGRMSESEA